MMSHQCVKCSELFPDGSNELLKGCSKCGGKFFFFVKKESLEKIKQLTVNLTKDEHPELFGQCRCR